MDEFHFDPYTSHYCYGMYEECSRHIPIVETVDVLIVGGSQSGCVAAIAAARNGAKAQLVEQYGFLGGQSVFGSVTQWEKRAFIDNCGQIETRGIPKEVVDRIVAKGNSDGLWQDPPGCSEMRDGEEWLDVQDIKMTLLEMVEEAHVQILLHTLAVDVMVDRTGSLPRVTGVIFESKTGRFVISAKIIIDATADADIVWRAIGDKGCGMRPPQERIGSGFYVWYGGIENAHFIEFALQQPDVIGYPDPHKFPDKVRRHLQESKLIYFTGGFSSIMKEADRRGLLDPIEDEMYKRKITGFVKLSMKWVGHDRWCMHLTEFSGLNQLDVWQLSDREIFRTKLEHYMLAVVRLIPGWEHAFIDRTNIRMGARESRFLKAVTMLTAKDIYYPDHARSDTVGRSGAHDPGKNRLEKPYPIPYGIMVPRHLDGILVCARSVGAYPHIALNAHRGITPGMVVGQAAGTAAALAIRSGIQPRAVNLVELQEILRKADVVLDIEVFKLKEVDYSKMRKIPTNLDEKYDQFE